MKMRCMARFAWFLLISFLLSDAANASWQTFQNDLSNSGSSEEVGFFPLKTLNFSNEIYGSDFQPLIDDIDNDGRSELILFSNDFLKIFDYELNLMDEQFTGRLLGQPAIFNKSIIFNSKINATNYFFNYKYSNSGLKRILGILLSNDADFSGIKCLKLNESNYCVFKDKLNYVHVIDIGTKTDNYYATSFYNETHQTVPAIGDIDNDGNIEAVFWHDNNSDNSYGMIAFDLNDRKIEWVADNIFTSRASSPSTFVLKGQPVLVDLNNDSKLEIAVSVFYDDALPNFSPYNDWFTELFVFSHNGSKLFSKCEYNAVSNNGCNDGSSEINKWEGTNPFVLDYDKNGVREICFIKDKKLSGYFKNMSINCYNYSGYALLDSELSPNTDTVKTAITADINNDGKKEVITPSKLYLLNGTSILGLDFGSNFVIPADLDGNSRLDLIMTRNGMSKLLIDDTSTIKVYDAQIKPDAPSIDDSLSCSWKINSDEKIVYANVSWYNSSNLYTSEDNIKCISHESCIAANKVPSSALNEGEVWKCSVAVFNGHKLSLPKSDTVIIFGRISEWKKFNKNDLSYGIASGSGYFSKSAIRRLMYNSSGIKLQPMAADIDNDENNEIVLFSNSSIVLLNKSLNVIAQKQVGDLRGQFDIENMDNDAYLEIIAVLNNSNADNFTIFEFNGSEFKIETSFDVTSQNGHQALKCADFDKDGAKECVFMDYNGIVHSYQINASSQYDDELSINASDAKDNVYESSRIIAPSFTDFDRDGDLDALLWFNDNIVVVDSNKNIVLNAGAGTLNAVALNEPTLLGLKFVNLDKTGNYEIAVAYRNDYRKVNSFKTDINLSLIDSHGSVIFSKIFDFYSANPCLNSNTHCLGHGSDLFVFDYNKDGFDDIGIYLEGDLNSPYGRFIKMFDRNGIEIASSAAEPGEGNSIAEAVTLADIDDDGELELLLRHNAFDMNGTIAYNFSYTAVKAPIAVDVDKNKGLDVLWFNDSSLVLFLDDNTYKADLSIEEKDISFSPLNSTSVLVKANVHNKGSLSADNVNIKLVNTETLESVEGIISVKSYSNSSFASILNVNRHDKVLAHSNYNNSIEEVDENNNLALKEFMGMPYVFVSLGVEQSPQLALQEIKRYIKDNLALGYFTDEPSEADIQIYIGKDNSLNLLDRFDTKNKYGWGYDSFATIDYFDKQYHKPYAGLVGSYILDSKSYIAIYGNQIDGDIAAAKEFIKHQSDFLYQNSERVVVIDDENVDAVGVFDYLHQPGNEQYYGDNSKNFANAVRNALRGETFSTEMKTVTTDNGVQLRLKHLMPNRSSTYLELLNASGVPVDMPVVLARGLWSNLTSWEVLGGELADEGRDVWLIEITGGPWQDCDNCVDYTFDDLTDKYVPTLLNAVLNFTNKSKMQYIGFSNGCRATLSSLEKGKFNSSKVETFVAVGCPGAFNGSSLFAECLSDKGDRIINFFNNNNISHLSERVFAERLKIESGRVSSCGLLSSFLHSDEKISKNLGQHYLNLIKSNQDLQPGIGLNLVKFSLIYGTEGFGSNNDNDYIVTENDELSIFNNVISNDKDIASYSLRHNRLPDNKRVKNTIRRELK